MRDRNVPIGDLVVEMADVALENQRDDGSMPPGHNGPWGHTETPVRNTGHWLVTFLRTFERTNDNRFREAGTRAADYLVSEKTRPGGYTFHHLDEDGASRPNGVIGQAWSIEALTTAATVLDRPDLIDLAADVFLEHPFDDTLAAWRVVDVDGDQIGFDLTFNHQLWFAAAGGLLADHPESPAEVDRQVRRFLDELETTASIDEDGIVQHPFKPELHPLKYAKIGVDSVRTGDALKLVRGALQSEVGDGMADRAVGYHSFNLYGFALLAETYPDHSFWESDAIRRALECVRRSSFRERLDGNPYGYPYNVSGIELAYVEDVFGEGDADRKTAWLDRQFERTYDPDVGRLSRNTADPTTLTARIYEATRIDDVPVSAEVLG